ncbi:IclR family transcriptional regulator [Hydrogenophaga sp. SNF1]|uniref:IclR family transcriptional regulator n=1 Tax=Hydrogenophaga sp. SNF1 TaxID=3098762 RepID=UPI002ACC0A73|nr:IclR family transcriptional regulator [Hydrogenophaga sp. SNF1]WQB84955.1 IclR family transcriptional regulator [Hydrogenophaga sp. SNF1]
MGRTAKPLKTRRSDAEGDRRFVTALARGLDVLRCYQPSERWLPNQEIAHRTGLPKATVSRMTYTLTALGYLEHSPEREMYALGLPVLGLGFRVLSHFELGRIARPFMQALADEAGAAVSLAVRSGGWAVYVAHCRSAAPLTLGLDVGARLSLARSAIGRAMLFSLDADTRDKALKALRAEAPAEWEQGRGGLAEAQAHLVRHGYVRSSPGADIGAVAVTLDPGDGRDRFGLNCGGPASSMDAARLACLGPRLIEMAARIERAIRSEN